MSFKHELEIDGRPIGVGHPCFIAAEVGINHNGDLDLAREMIEAAATAGADGVKFQNYRTEDFLVDRSLTYEYVSQGETVVETQFDMFKRYEMPREWLPELKKCCDSQGVAFFSTPTSTDGVQDLLDVGVTVFKNGSDYLGHLPLIAEFARTGLPTVLSTGMATQDEVDAAVEAFRDAGGNKLVLLHCTSAYPTPLEDANLARMTTLRERYDCPVGFSDHTEGNRTAGVSAAMGAVFIEKHFTTDPGLSGPDHRFSATPEALAELVRLVREVEQVRGSGEVVPAASESVGRTSFRLSCHAARDVCVGTELSEEDICVSRPGDGSPPSQLSSLIGRRIRKPLGQGDPINAEVLEERA